MDDDMLRSYYGMAWEVGLLDLIKDEVLARSPMKFRIMGAVDFVKVDSNKLWRVLDIGCGVGTTSFLIGEKHQNTIFTCVDISDKQIQLGRKYAESMGIQDRYEFVIGDVSKPLACFDRHYDYIIACEILEHLPDPRNLLENSKRCGNHLTKYIFSFPLGKNKNNCIVFRVVDENGNHFVTNNYSKAKEYKEFHEFYHKLYSSPEAIRLLQSYGYSVERIIGARFLKGSSLGYYFHRITNYSRWADQTINRLTNNYFAENIILESRAVQISQNSYV